MYKNMKLKNKIPNDLIEFISNRYFDEGFKEEFIAAKLGYNWKKELNYKETVQMVEVEAVIAREKQKHNITE